MAGCRQTFPPIGRRSRKWKTTIAASAPNSIEALSDPERCARWPIPEFGDTLLHVAIEHRLMHAETLAYLLHNLPVDRKIPQPGVAH